MEKIQPVSPGPINIRISVANKVAQNDSPEVTLVCGNTDQWVTFSFLEPEWNAYPVKTARFVYFRGGRLQHTDVPFTGAAAPVPLLTQITEVFVGVYAGALCATTPARVGCLSSIVCNSGGDIPANSEAYAQVLACISRAVYATEAAAAEANEAAETAKTSAASVRAACSTRLEIIPDNQYGGTLRVYLDGHIPEGAALAVYRRSSHRTSDSYGGTVVNFRDNRWNCAPAGYARVCKLPYWASMMQNQHRPYPPIPDWMPNGGHFQNYFPLPQKNISNGYFDIPNVHGWLLPMVKPKYTENGNHFNWEHSRIIGAQYRSGYELVTPAQFGFAIVQPREDLGIWQDHLREYPILGRWKNTMSVWGYASLPLIVKATASGGYYDAVRFYTGKLADENRAVDLQPGEQIEIPASDSNNFTAGKYTLSLRSCGNRTTYEIMVDGQSIGAIHREGSGWGDYSESIIPLMLNMDSVITIKAPADGTYGWVRSVTLTAKDCRCFSSGVESSGLNIVIR